MGVPPPAPCEACALVARALEGPDPALVAVLPHSVLRLGDHQAYPGYAVLFSREHARELHHLGAAAAQGFHADLLRASAAVERATGCWKLNLASLGNAVGHVHVHLFPRSAEDPERLRHPWAHEARFGDPGDPALRAHWIARLKEALA